MPLARANSQPRQNPVNPAAMRCNTGLPPSEPVSACGPRPVNRFLGDPDRRRPATPAATPAWKEVDDLVPRPSASGAGAAIRVHAHWVAGPAPDPTVVLLHGLLSSGLQWRGTLTRLAGAFALWAPDLPGFGRSGLIRMPQLLPDYADTLEAWAEQRGLRRVVLVGHSFGGMVAIDWAARHPGRVAALGLLAPVAVPHAFRVPPSFARPMTGRLLLLLVSLPYIRERFFRYVVDDVAAVPLEERRGYARSMRRCRALLGLRDFYTFPDMRATLGAVRCPVRLGWGLRDRVLPVADADVVEDAVPGLRAVRWPCGHSVMAERPADGDRFIRDVVLAAAP